MTKAMKKVNFFIVGAPRCGTTSMYRYLNQHPQVFMSSKKEPHFFGKDLVDPDNISNESAYRELFSGAREEEVLGEASVWSLYSNSALKEISLYNPEAKIIAMFRHPVQMLQSLHAHHCFTGYEEILNFSEALLVSEKNSRKVENVSFRRKISYLDAARYSTQLERVFAVFPREKVHIIFFEDFAASPEKEYAKVLRFLDLPSFKDVDFTIHNERRVRKSDAFHLGLNLFRRTASLLIRQIPPLHKEAKRRLTSRRKANRNSPPREIQDHILKTLSDEIAQLSEFTGRDLSTWGLRK